MWSVGAVRRIRPAAVAGAGAVLAAVILLLIPVSVVAALTAGAAAALVASLGGAAVAGVVAARTRGAERFAFLCLACLFGVWAATRVVRLVALAGHLPVSEWPSLEGAWIAVALLGVTGSILLYAHHRERRSWAGPIDAVVVAVSVAILVWSLVYDDADLAHSGRITTLFLASITAVMVGMGGMILWRRSPARPWMGWGILAMLPLIGDVVLSDVAAREADAGLRAVTMACGTLTLGCLGAFALARLRAGERPLAAVPSRTSRRPWILRSLPSATLVAAIAVLMTGRGAVGVLAMVAAVLLAVRVERSRARIERLLDERSHLALIDPLTGAYNRRRFTDEVPELARRADETGAPAAVIALDLDNFKRANDVRGHAAGDTVLRAVATAITGNLREHDRLFRLGGDEFVVLLPDTRLADAERIAERLRVAVAGSAAAVLPDGPSVTTSIGVASLRPGPYDGQSAPAEADLALYQAKALGRDRVVVAPDGSAPPEPGG